MTTRAGRPNNRGPRFAEGTPGRCREPGGTGPARPAGPTQSAAPRPTVQAEQAA